MCAGRQSVGAAEWWKRGEHELRTSRRLRCGGKMLRRCTVVKRPSEISVPRNRHTRRGAAGAAAACAVKLHVLWFAIENGWHCPRVCPGRRDRRASPHCVRATYVAPKACARRVELSPSAMPKTRWIATVRLYTVILRCYVTAFVASCGYRQAGSG